MSGGHMDRAKRQIALLGVNAMSDENAESRDEFALACIEYVRRSATIHNDDDARRIVAEYEGELK